MENDRDYLSNAKARFRVRATRRVRHVLKVLLIVTITLTSITSACYRLHLNVATAALLYVVFVMLVSRFGGGFLLSTVGSVAAALCLAYLAPPAGSWRVSDPLDLIAVGTFLVISLVIAYLVSKLHHMVCEARSSVNRRLIDAEEQERTRIARELHDDISQRLSLLVLELEGLQQDTSTSTADLREEIKKASKRIEDLGRDIQILSHRLHSSKLDYLGLKLAAASFCRELSSRQGIEIDFHSEEFQNELSGEVSFTLFRVLQESLLNAVKHSNSRQFRVSLSHSENDIELEVRDSGIGFDPREAMKGQGLGLTSMKERLKLVGGTLSIASRRGHGTMIQARAPARPIGQTIEGSQDTSEHVNC